MTTSAVDSPGALAATEAGQRLLHPEYQRLLARVPHELIVDLDDTLNVNAPLFQVSVQSLLDVCQALQAAGVGPATADREELLSRHVEINHLLLPTLGYTPKRWRLAAQQLASEAVGRPLTPDEQRLVRAASEEAMGIGDLYPGVAEALRALGASPLRAALKTKGEVAKQQEKIHGHQLEGHFDHVAIVGSKSAASFRELAGHLGFANPVSIGDRYGADIEPALACGFRGILISPSGVPDWELGAREIPAGLELQGSFPEALRQLAEEQRR